MDRPLAVVANVNTTPVTYYVSVDHLNRPVKMTDAAKASVRDAVWQPWGGVHSITGTASLDARLPGQWFQAETGLHYNWHRQYDPSVGRYTQPDPLGFVDGPSVYGYVKGLQQSEVDRDGRYAQSLAVCAINPAACVAVATVAAICIAASGYCKLMSISCRAKCQKDFEDGNLPGAGPDMSGRQRRCVRECMVSAGCNNY